MLKDKLNVRCCDSPGCKSIWLQESGQGARCYTCDRDVCKRHTQTVTVRLAGADKNWGTVLELDMCPQCTKAVEAALYSCPETFSEPYKRDLTASIKALFCEITGDEKYLKQVK